MIKCKHPDIKKGDKLKICHPWLGKFTTKVIGFDKMHIPYYLGCKWVVFNLPKTGLPYHVACCSDRILEVA